MGGKIAVKREPPLCWITLNRPEQLNALDMEMLGELEETMKELEEDREVSVVVVNGAGKAFCAGADIKRLVDLDMEGALSISRSTQRVAGMMESSRKVYIAEINGPAIGGGLEIAMGADMRIAAKAAKLGLAEVNIGLIPAGGGTVRLPRLVGMGRAREMMLLGKAIGADEALRIGLVNMVCDAEALDAEARKIAAEISKKAPLAVMSIKLCRNPSEDLESGLFSFLINTSDAREGMQAFIERRAPKFTGR
ncbi:MAG: enoyl-CoA hydratase/isomerase family protein [Nitrososphaerota archaeon]|nr:enoyl-CoA hydratase/isomerase family protein [Nitrososphaerota archaeon]MDG6935747.1 enoyl-CoA hydratase/isomerase family protein [Nitrososphaerota archaeon]